MSETQMNNSLLTVMIDAGCILPSSANCGTFWIRPIAIMDTSGKLRSGEPNFPPIAPILLNVIVPPQISTGLSLLPSANCCNLDSSFVIYKPHLEICISKSKAWDYDGFKEVRRRRKDIRHYAIINCTYILLYWDIDHQKQQPIWGSKCNLLQ